MSAAAEDDDMVSTVEVCRLTGATYRQVDWWCRTGRIPGQPSGAATGSGHRRRWTPDQIVRVLTLMRASRLVNATIDEAVEMLEP